MRFFGWVDRVDGTCAIATPFVHLGGLPLVPRPSHLVDTTSLQTSRAGLGERTTFASVPLGTLVGRSVLAAYFRAYGAIAVLFGIASYAGTAWAGTSPLWALGLLLIVAAWILTFTGQVRISNVLELAGFGLAAGTVAALPLGPSVAIGLAGLATVGVSLLWRKAPMARAIELGARMGVGADDIEAIHRP